MLKIAHRGNTNGKSKLENNPDYIKNTIALGYDVEIDIWCLENKYYLGHNFPEYPVTELFIHEILQNAWFHCKNLESLYYLSKVKGCKYFWHEDDDFTLTSSGHIWTYPGKKITELSIIVDLDIPKISLYTVIPYGICSDYVSHI
jgi:hypothetical protein